MGLEPMPCTSEALILPGCSERLCPREKVQYHCVQKRGFGVYLINKTGPRVGEKWEKFI
jgi:hypothetical protein